MRSCFYHLLFKANETTVNIPFHHGGIQYNPNQPEQYTADILKFCKLELSAQYNIDVWIFLRFLMRHYIIVLREMRPGYQELGYVLHRLKTSYGSSSQFTELRRNFSYLFTNVEFDVFPKSNGGNNNQFSIKINEDSKDYDLEESASGYFEVLILLFQVGTEKEDILIIDEPALAKPTISGAMTKAVALSPTVRLNADLSRLRISLRNRFIQDILSIYHLVSNNFHIGIIASFASQ